MCWQPPSFLGVWEELWVWFPWWGVGMRSGVAMETQPGGLTMALEPRAL